MRRPRTATALLAGALALGTPALAACSEDEPTTQQVENDVEDLDDEGSVPGVGDSSPGAQDTVVSLS